VKQVGDFEREYVNDCVERNTAHKGGLNIKEMNEDSRISRSGSGGWYWVMRSRVVAVVKSLGVRGLESRR